MTAERCSVGSALAGEPLAGTAPRAIGWVALEQNGPWGAKALTESHLHPEVGAGIEVACQQHGLRPALIRRPGRHPDHGAPRTVLLAHTTPGHTWLLEGQVDHPRELLDLDWRAVAAGDREAAARSLPGARLTDLPALLVCTNGSRDRCCAIEGRKAALAAHDLLPGRIWETTHLSGHRFSATAVALPSGLTHGRLDPEGVAGLIDALGRGRTTVASLRGRSTWSAHGQAAEIAVRESTGEDLVDAIVSVEEVSRPGEEGAWEVRHQDGRRWTVEVTPRDTGSARPESCGKALVALIPLYARLLAVS